MKVQCVLCDRIETIPDDSFEAKKLKTDLYIHICAQIATKGLQKRPKTDWQRENSGFTARALTDRHFNE